MDNALVFMDAEEENVNPNMDVECSICLLTIPQSESFSLKLCGCAFCRACLLQLIKINVDGRTIQRLKCPGKHDTQILRREVKSIVDSQTYVRYIRLCHENSVLMDPARSFCPRPGCDAVCHSSGRLGARAIRCVECGYKFCSLCRDRWHGKEGQCPEDIHVTKQPQSSENEDAANDRLMHAQFYQDDILVETLTNNRESDPAMSMVSDNTESKPNVKRCPKCGVPIEKQEGCSHMKCARCGHSFCWVCLASLDHDFFLRHYESGPCRNSLGYPRGMIHLYRFQAVCLVCGLGTLALICAPFAIICSPCIVLCAPYIPQHFNNGEDENSPFASNSWPNIDEYGDDTDSEADVNGD